MRVADVMQKTVMSVSPELPLIDLEEFLTAEDIGGVPVLGAQGQLIGVASKTDIVRALSDRNPRPLAMRPNGLLTVDDIMTREIYSVGPDEDVCDVARCMIDGHIHRLLVCRDGEVLGIVTPFDLLGVLAS